MSGLAFFLVVFLDVWLRRYFGFLLSLLVHRAEKGRKRLIL
jgi:hypothetical protein